MAERPRSCETLREEFVGLMLQNMMGRLPGVSENVGLDVTGLDVESKGLRLTVLSIGPLLTGNLDGDVD